MSVRFGATELEAAKCLWVPQRILLTPTPGPSLSADPSLQQVPILITVTAATTLSQPEAPQLFLSTMFILLSSPSWDLSILSHLKPRKRHLSCPPEKPEEFSVLP